MESIDVDAIIEKLLEVVVVVVVILVVLVVLAVLVVCYGLIMNRFVDVGLVKESNYRTVRYGHCVTNQDRSSSNNLTY